MFRPSHEHSRFFRGLPFIIGICAAVCAPCFAIEINVRHHGAAGDGQTIDTQAIQSAIALAAEQGGGIVHFPTGRYLTGTLFLRDNVLLDLSAGAEILGSTNLEHYPTIQPAFRSYTERYTDKALIYAEGVRNTGIQGTGVVNGQGGAFRGKYKERPFLVRFVSCSDVTVRDVTLRDGAMWTLHLLACDNALISGISILARCNKQNDGINIDSSKNVRVINNVVSSGDDAIVLKSTSSRPCENITITNCVVSSDANGIKLGTESNTGFFNIVVSNCIVHDTLKAGLALEMVDGGILDGVTASNIVMTNTNAPVFIRLGNRARPYKEGLSPPGMGRLRNVVLRDITATGAGAVGCSITGMPDQFAENIRLSRINIVFKGGGTTADAFRRTPLRAADYPEFDMFGTLPAYGFFCRHVSNLTLEDITLTTDTTDHRPALVMDEVSGFKISGLQGSAVFRQHAFVWLRNSRHGRIVGCIAPPATQYFLRVDGKHTKNIRVAANDIRNARHIMRRGNGVVVDNIVQDEGNACTP